MVQEMKVIGLTGGIGSGKSTVARYLAEMGAVVIDLDKVGHEVLKSGGGAYEKVVREFGKDILDAQGEIDRAKLAKIVFHNHKALASLNQLVHPAIDEIINERIESCRQQEIKVVVLEAAVMLEAGKIKQVGEIWVITAPKNTVLQRIGVRSGYSREEAEARLRAQMSDEERIKHADVVIDTDASLDDVKARVQKEWAKLMGRSGG
jgi:dephospho-CoA kinase